jgi:peptidoglycan/LPS O-acetylase OafA/YrhL
VREAQDTDTVSLVAFYARRARRILPAAMITVLGTVIAARLALNFLQATTIARDGLWASGFVANFRFAALGTDYLTSTAPPSPLQHFWSLAIEEQFYLVWPLLVWGCARLSPRRHLRRTLTLVATALCAASLVTSVLLTASSATAAYFSPFSRAWELGLGAVLALTATSLHRVPVRLATPLGAAGLVAVAAAAALFDERTAFPGFAAALPVLGTVAVIAAGSVSERGGAERLLRAGPLQWLGSRSFAWYLVHYPVIVIAETAHGEPLSLPTALALAAASLLLANGLHHVVENPLRHSPRLSRSNGASLAAGVGATIVAIAVAQGAITFGSFGAPGQTLTADAGAAMLARTAEVPTVADELAAAIEADALGGLVVPLQQVSEDRPAAYGDGCHARFETAEPPACWYGPADAATTVVLFGDSHAAQWLPTLEASGQYRILLMTKSSCPFVDVRTWNSVDKREYVECEQFHDRAMSTIAEVHPDLVIASSMLNSSVLADDPDQRRQIFLDGMRSTLAQLQPAAARVVVLGDTPNLGLTAVNCVASHAGDLGSCATPRHEAVDAGLIADIGQLTASMDVDLVDPTGWLCADELCPAVSANTVIYADDTHLSATYAAHLADPLADALTG